MGLLRCSPWPVASALLGTVLTATSGWALSPLAPTLTTSVVSTLGTTVGTLLFG